ncbi:cell division protein FtsA [Candidatus Azambacteria bacterium]|nr:cell division protein FtsA [Candidatus Azambacteria bacterium]MBI3685293.1 cell division protein FtsA [Candidatus Azambacteria bacterium]
MARTVTICGLDIGSHTIRVVVAQKRKEHDRFSLVGVGEAPSAGMRKGTVVDNEEATAAIKEALKAAEQASGYKIRSAYVGMSGAHISSRYVKGVVSVSRADQEISRDDIARVLAQAQSIAAPLNKEIIHALPKEYIVDGEAGIHDPLGMHGLRLEAVALVVEGSASVIKNIVGCVEAAGVDVEGLMAAQLAASYAVLSKRQKELGVLLLDIGGTTSGLAAFEEGSMIHAATLPVGSAHITNDIAIGLQAGIDIAETIKTRYGVCRPEQINKKEMIRIPSDDGSEQIDNVSRKEVGQIIEARLDELFELADKELKKISRQVLFPAGVVVIGGGANMTGMAEFAKDRLRLPAHIGAPEHIDGVVDQLAGPQYATAVGLCLMGLEAEEKGGSMGVFRISGRFGERVRRWFKAFLP